MDTYYRWDNDKNNQLKHTRGICFEQVILQIDKGELLDIVTHTNKLKYPKQKMLIVNINNYAYLVPFIQQENEVFLKTIIPSRKATKKYLRGEK